MNRMCANVSPFVHSVHGNPNFNPTKLGARQTQIMVFIIITIITITIITITIITITITTITIIIAIITITIITFTFITIINTCYKYI
jgi:hypothetical protein